MIDAEPIVFIVDDDSLVRTSLKRLVSLEGWRVEAFASAKEFLQGKALDGTADLTPACLILDVQLPDLNGLDFQGELVKAGIRIPIIFITGHGDIPMSVRAMKAGAVGFLTKPFSNGELISSIQEAIEQDRLTIQKRTERLVLERRYELLTPREKEVFAHVVTGKLNKQIAFDLNVTEKTIKVHRALVMQKMQAESLADLVRMAEKLQLAIPDSSQNSN
ncbi:MAG: response regulator transcription factor [Acidobacteria bacterium]|nr:response regulator transcription factor [Acidobacteriota bacterium]